MKRNPLGLAGTQSVSTMLSTNTCLRTDLVSIGIGEDGLAVIMDELVANTQRSQLRRLFPARSASSRCRLCAAH